MNRRTFLAGFAAALASPKLLTDARALPAVPDTRRLRCAGDVLIAMLKRISHDAKLAAAAQRLFAGKGRDVAPTMQWMTTDLVDIDGDLFFERECS